MVGLAWIRQVLGAGGALDTAADGAWPLRGLVRCTGDRHLSGKRRAEGPGWPGAFHTGRALYRLFAGIQRYAYQRLSDAAIGADGHGARGPLAPGHIRRRP